MPVSSTQCFVGAVIAVGMVCILSILTTHFFHTMLLIRVLTVLGHSVRLIVHCSRVKYSLGTCKRVVYSRVTSNLVLYSLRVTCQSTRPSGRLFTRHPVCMQVSGGGRAAVSWPMIRKIFVGWIVTVPVAAGLSALIYWALERTLTGVIPPPGYKVMFVLNGTGEL